MAYNREAQPQSSVRSRGRAVRLTKAIKNIRQEFGSNTNAGIDHRNLNSKVLLRNLNPDFSAVRRELDGITKEIPKDLLETVGVAKHHTIARFNLSFKLNLLGFKRGTY